MTTSPDAISPDASVGYVHLTAGDLPRMLHFYGEVLGFRPAWRDGDETVYLSADGRYPFHLGLSGAPGAARGLRGAAGLYHAAFLLPDRRWLARTFLRLRASGIPLDGASDHRVSEALYLRDPEGNGLEFYADRPREQWPHLRGQIMMTTEPLDLDDLYEEVGAHEDAWSGVPPETRLGHVHLRVSDLDRAEAFYHGALGFDVTLREYPGALFLSAGGYHHHLGVNVWGSPGPQAPPAEGRAGARLGLRCFTVRLPDRADLARAVRRVQRHGARVEAAVDHGLCAAVALRDQDGIGVVLTADREPGRRDPAGWTHEPLDLGALLHA